MHRKSLNCLVLGVILMLLLPGWTAAESGDPVVLIDGRPITRAMLEAYAPAREWELGDVASPEAREKLIQELIDEELLAREAERLGLAEEPSLVAELELERRQVLATAAVRQHLEQHAPSEEQIRQAYQETAPGMAPREYLVRHIQVDYQNRAETLIGELKDGADLDRLAAAHSTAASAPYGGDLGWLTANQFQRYFGFAPHLHDPTQAQLPVLFDEPGQNSYGWQVVRIDEIREGKPPSLEGARDMIVRILEQRIYRDYLAQLRRQAQIEVRWNEPTS